MKKKKRRKRQKKKPTIDWRTIIVTAIIGEAIGFIFKQLEKLI